MPLGILIDLILYQQRFLKIRDLILCAILMVELTPVIADQLAGCSEHLPLDVYGPGVRRDQGGEHHGGEHHQQV